MSYDIYCLGLSSPLLPDGYGSFHWRVMALQPWACSAFLEMPFPSAREAKPLLRTGFLSCPFLRTEEHFFHWRGSSPPESLYLKRCSLHLPVKLRSWGHFQPTFFFFSEKPSSIIVQLEVHWSITVWSSVLSYTTFTPVSTVLAFPLSELLYIHVLLSVFQTFVLLIIYIYLTSYFHNSSPNVALNFLTGSTMSKAY